MQVDIGAAAHHDVLSIYPVGAIQMNVAKLIVLVLQISIALIVCSIALRAGPGSLGYLFRRPSLLLRSLLSMNIVMPCVAVAMAQLFHLRPEIETTLILLSVSPVPPVLPGKQGKAGGNVSYGVGLLMFAALFSIVAIPVLVAVIGKVFGADIHVPAAAIAKVVAISVLIPLVVGMIVARVAPAFAARIAKPVNLISLLVAVIGLVPVFVLMWPAIMALIGDFTLVALIVFTVIGLVVGTLLGGPDPEDRTVLGLSTAVRHPGVAVAIAGAVTEDKKPIIAAVLLAALVAAIVTAPYVKMRKKKAGA
jgi:BASS family bile acid:Na+ symporter